MARLQVQVQVCKGFECPFGGRGSDPTVTRKEPSGRKEGWTPAMYSDLLGLFILVSSDGLRLGVFVWPDSRSPLAFGCKCAATQPQAVPFFLPLLYVLALPC